MLSTGWFLTELCTGLSGTLTEGYQQLLGLVLSLLPAIFMPDFASIEMMTVDNRAGHGYNGCRLKLDSV